MATLRGKQSVMADLTGGDSLYWLTPLRERSVKAKPAGGESL